MMCPAVAGSFRVKYSCSQSYRDVYPGWIGANLNSHAYIRTIHQLNFERLNFERPNFVRPNFERPNFEWPNLERLNFERLNFEKDSTSKRTQLRKTQLRTTQLRKGLNFEKDPTSKLNFKFELRKSIGLNFEKDPTSKLNFEFELRKTIYSWIYMECRQKAKTTKPISLDSLHITQYCIYIYGLNQAILAWSF